MPLWLSAIATALLLVMVLKTVLTVPLAGRYHASRRRASAASGDFRPTVTVIVPAFNEAITIGNCLRSLARQSYEALNVVVVDDGSKDGTADAASSVFAESGRVAMSLVRKANGGKASALNEGIMSSDADIVVCVDADSILAPDAIEKLVEPFRDPTVGAVGGTVKVADAGTLLGRQQAMEYIAGLSLQRAAFAQLNAVQVLSGAISAFRRDVLRSLGGYSSDTVVEDFDVTVAVQAAGYRAVLHPGAVAYTEGPCTLSDLVKQRRRWAFGGFQVLAKYRRVVFGGEIGLLSRVGLPYFLIFPWVDVLVSLVFVGCLATTVLTGSFVEFVAFLLVTSVLALMLNLYALHLAKEPWVLAWYGFLQALFYAHVLTYATLIAGLSYLGGVSARWEKLERTGLNVMSEQVGA